MIKTSDGKNVEEKLGEVFQSGLDGKNKLETSIKSKGGKVSKQREIATFDELDNGVKSIITDPTGDATASSSNILKGKTAYSKGKKLTGSMPNNGSISKTITSQNGKIYIPKGYHSGNGYMKANFANLVAENIKAGVNIGGIKGSCYEYKIPSNSKVKTLSYSPHGTVSYTASVSGTPYGILLLEGYRDDSGSQGSSISSSKKAIYIRGVSGYLGSSWCLDNVTFHNDSVSFRLYDVYTAKVKIYYK